jgi:hypothetical protein
MALPEVGQIELVAALKLGLESKNERPVSTHVGDNTVL